MKLTQLLAASLLPLATFAAKSSGDDKFNNYRATQLSKSLPIQLDDSSYATLIGRPRTYAAVILLTALEAKFGCQACHDFGPEWDLLSKSWTKGDKNGDSKLVFGTLDFSRGQGTFRSLELVTAPILLLYPPSDGPNAVPDAAPKRLDFSQNLQNAEAVHAWLSRHLPDQPHPPFHRPFNYFRVAILVVVLIGILSAVVVAGPYLLPVLQNRTLWAAGSLIAILLFTSGHMFNHIRGVPYVAGDGKGKVSYFAQGFQNQYGLETQIVAGIYGLLAFATISLALKVPRIADPRTQQIAVFVWSGIMLVAYSYLLSLFRTVKNQGFPYWLPPF